MCILLFIVGGIVLLDQDNAHTTVNSACGPYKNDKTITISKQKFDTELAATPDQRTTGLSGRPCILPTQAMLFDFGKTGQYPIWMKDMKFAIDIIWLGSDYRVVGFYTNIDPSTYPDSFVNEKERPARYVLEIKAGRSDQLKLTLGTPVKL